MAIPDFVRFGYGNSISEPYVGEWFQTMDLFGYFEKYTVRADGTIWLTPTKLIASGRSQVEIDAPELVKVDQPPVQIMLRSPIELYSDEISITAVFSDGVLTHIC